MITRSLDEQLVKYLTDAHAIEEQALVQMRRAPDLAATPPLEQGFREHLEETKGHERLVDERLKAHGAQPSSIKDAVMKAGGGGFTLFAQSQPDTPGKLAAHAYSYEHLELAAYELLARVAERADDRETAQTAQRIADEERRMGARLAGLFDAAVDASLDAKSDEEIGEQLVKYLADAHGIEEQSVALLGRARTITHEADVRSLFEEHLAESEHHRELVEERLEEHNAKSSALKGAAMRLGALNWSLFFQAQPDTVAKLSAFAYAFEHLEIAGYEQLARVAARAHDGATEHVARQILEQERGAAQKIAQCFDVAVDAALDANAVPRSVAAAS